MASFLDTPAAMAAEAPHELGPSQVVEATERAPTNPGEILVIDFSL